MQSYEYQTMRSVEDSYWWYAGLRTRVIASLLRAYDKNTALRILDAGCGTGGMLSILCSQFPSAEIIGIDVNDLAVRSSQERKAGQVINASVNNLPFQDSVFDIIISLDVVAEQTGVDDHKALAEFHRTLNTGGMLVLNLTAFEFLRGQHDAAVHVGKRYTKNKLNQHLSSAGFSIDTMTYWNALFFPILVFWRPLSRLFADVSMPVSDLRQLPEFINRTLAAIVRAELKLTHMVSLPFGSSLFALAKKN